MDQLSLHAQVIPQKALLTHKTKNKKNLVKFQLYGDLISLNGKVDVFGLFGFLMNAVQY